MEEIELRRGDCLEIMKSIPSESMDMILTDPPFGNTRNHWDKVTNPNKMFREFKRIIKPHGVIVIFSQLPFAVDLINACRKLYRYEWIWQKTLPVGFLNANRMPMRAHENILVFYKHLPKYRPIYRGGINHTRPRMYRKTQKTMGIINQQSPHPMGKDFPSM